MIIDERFIKWSMVLVEAGKPSPSLAGIYKGNTKGLIFYKTRELASNAATKRNEQLAGTKSTSRFKIIKLHDAEAQQKHDFQLKQERQRRDARHMRRFGF
ncbi:TPA: hypothetical protein ACG31E_000947 [Escherichia coli]|uniref:hypothetical protein n=1 Tax=Escherichia coli TaxID=562 RepID=UPI0015EA045E|nr:hypothetical protein [Escherichia coli]ELQ0713832.1 hypothetical protein [Escherichia coli O8]EEW1950241.1 hypothetical protein [Escherichia coli]EFA5280504.1 hypothetical protein [Escherichia coli]EFE6001883.1 hypothetical protein [Escherichia coli]EFE6062932.1 hypothetical protein [Escherichia coli]